MRVVLTGATGMVGSGTLREALADPDVEAVLSVGRRASGVRHPKLRELLLPDLFEFTSVEPELAGWDACLWGLGISSVGLDERAYARVTVDLTLLWAQALLRLNPGFSFAYCSAAGTDKNTMWARVRRRTELGLEAMPFRHAGCVRPGYIQPGPGIRSNTRLYQALITLARPLSPLMVRAAPQWCTTSARLGRAMLRIVQGRADRFILESSDINRIGD